MNQKIPIEKQIALTLLEARIIEALQSGHANATKLKELVKIIGKNERVIRIAIESLRRQHYAILIAPDEPFGYFFAKDREELEEYLRYMRSRLIEEYKTYRIVKKATLTKLEKGFGQLPLFFK